MKSFENLSSQLSESMGGSYILSRILLIGLVQAQRLDQRPWINNGPTRQLQPSKNGRQAVKRSLLPRRFVHAVTEGDVVEPQLEEGVRL